MRYLAALALLVLSATPIEGVAFLKLTGVTGDSTVRGHEGEIQVLNWSAGASTTQAVGGAGTGTGKVTLRDIKVRKRVDRASPQLFDLVFKGRHSAEAILTERRGGTNPIDYYRVRMEDVVVASVTDVPSTGPAGSPPEEEVVLRFATLAVSFTPQKPDGSLDAPICTCWNKLTATSCPCRLTGSSR